MNVRSPQEIGQQVESFRAQCRRAGLAVTHQREVIYRVVIELDDHPSAEAIYERVRERIPSISLGTVYKNLHTFLETGLLRQVNLLHGSLRVDPNTAPHHHFICVRCRTISDLDESYFEPVKLRRRFAPGFEFHRISVEAHGLCPACSAQPV